ncbi:MAG: pyruvate kinase [Deltaproteobacteria bacterium]|nr:pyruvate kinase [Deltaproteobacteria bacterium]
MRCAKIICTIGPATLAPGVLEELVAAGMDVARLNFSHGEHTTHAEAVSRIRLAAQRAGRPVGLLADLCGPKMRVGRFRDGSVVLTEGQEFVLTTRDVEGDATQVDVSYERLPDDVKEGDVILLDDGLLRLRVRTIDGRDVRCIVEVGGTLSDRKGMNMPGAALSAPAMTEKDRDDLLFAKNELKVDYIALSFVRTADDLREAKELAGDIPVIAKIEKPAAVANLESIAEVCDGIMVARGDLGVELGPEKVPMVQKRAIRELNRRGKLVITATQMLDSMIRNARPTRAEAADVANAILDGSDALMLSGETAAGKYPIEALRMMDLIVREVEREQRAIMPTDALNAEEQWSFANAAARAAAALSQYLPLKAIIVQTRDGRTARLLSDYRPHAPIVALTPSPRIASGLTLYWGVIPRVDVPAEDTEEALRHAVGVVVRERLAQSGDMCALVLGWPASGGTNMVKLHRL